MSDLNLRKSILEELGFSQISTPPTSESVWRTWSRSKAGATCGVSARTLNQRLGQCET